MADLVGGWHVWVFSSVECHCLTSEAFSLKHIHCFDFLFSWVSPFRLLNFLETDFNGEERSWVVALLEPDIHFFLKLAVFELGVLKKPKI